MTKKGGDQEELGKQIEDVLESACGPKSPVLKDSADWKSDIRPVKVNFYILWGRCIQEVSDARYLKMSEKHNTVFI